MSSKKVAICGGGKALGEFLVGHLKKNGFWVASIDDKENKDADLSLLIELENDVDSEDKITSALMAEIKEEKLFAIIYISEYCINENPYEKLLRVKETNNRLNICTRIAYRLLDTNGIWIFTTTNGTNCNVINYLVKAFLTAVSFGKSELPSSIDIIWVKMEFVINMRHKDKKDQPELKLFYKISEIFASWMNGEKPESREFLLKSSQSNVDLVPIKNSR